MRESICQMAKQKKFKNSLGMILKKLHDPEQAVKAYHKILWLVFINIHKILWYERQKTPIVKKSQSS